MIANTATKSGWAAHPSSPAHLILHLMPEMLKLHPQWSVLQQSFAGSTFPWCQSHLLKTLCWLQQTAGSPLFKPVMIIDSITLSCDSFILYSVKESLPLTSVGGKTNYFIRKQCCERQHCCLGGGYNDTLHLDRHLHVGSPAIHSLTNTQTHSHTHNYGGHFFRTHI